jgi:hypothetical protein
MDSQQNTRQDPPHPELNSMGNASAVQDEQPIVVPRR